MAMPRRRRRHDSTSSVETVDESNIRWCQEASIIKAGPKDEDPASYPVFELRNACVFGRDPEGSESSTFQNALEVVVKGPFTVRGSLIVEDADQKSRLLRRQRGNIPLEIRTVAQYSIGLSNAGQPVFWVLGQCGVWYEITPMRAYKPLYDISRQAITLYYAIDDFYQPDRYPDTMRASGGRQGELARLFLEYAAKVGDGSTHEDVVERCETHAIFLFNQFEQGDKMVELRPDVEDKGFDHAMHWRDTGFYQWLKGRRNDALSKVQAAIKNSPNPALRKATLRHSTPPEIQPPPARSRKRSTSSRVSADLPDSTVKGPVRKARPIPSQEPKSTIRSTPASQDPLPEPQDLPSQTTLLASASTPHEKLCLEKVMDALVSLRNEVKAGKEVKASSIVTNMYLGYKFPGKREKGEYRKPPEEVLQYYAPLLVKDQGFVSAIQGTNLLLWLQEQAKVPFRPTSLAPDEFPYLLVPRSKMSKPATAASQPEIVQTAAPIKDKTPTPVSSKRPTGRPRKSVLRLATGSRKRPHSELEYGSDPDDFENKRSNYFSDDNETVDGIVGHDNASEDSHELVEKASPIPDLNEPVRLVIRGESVATPAVVGDETRWVCEHNGCAYVVRNEADHIAQERIRSHMEEHAEEDQRVSLALSESRAHLPIDHLLEKIKQMGQDKARVEQKKAGGSASLVQPIKRKLFT